MDQAGDPAHQVGLEVVKHAVGAGDVPQHLDHFDPVFEIEAGLDHAGEGVELVRIFHRFLAQCDQFLDLGAFEGEAAFDQPGNGFALGFVEVAVYDRGLDEKGDRGDLDVIGAAPRAIGRGVIGAVVENKGLDSVEHGPCLSHPFGQEQPFDGGDLPLPGLARLRTFKDMNETPNRAGDRPGNRPDNRPDNRQFAPATGRNRDAIAAVLQRVLPKTGLVVEIGAGSGEHAAYFAPRFPGLTWQPTEPDADGRASIKAWAEAANVPNLRPPLDLDVTRAVWPVTEADAVFCANMIHISPWQCCLGLMAGAGRILTPRGEDGETPDRDQKKAGVLVLYGPFKRDGEHTAPSNADFDAGLKSRDPAWGVRDLSEVTEAALDNGLALEQTVDMPANNLMAIFRR